MSKAGKPTWGEPTKPVWGVHNIDADPVFVNEIVGQPGSFRLSRCSPCIDAASNLTVPADAADLDNDGDTGERTPLDLDLGLRFIDDPQVPDSGEPDPPTYLEVVDMGAYEFVCHYDLNGDGCLDSADLSILLAAWAAGTAGGHLDCDGDTDSADLTLLLTAWAAGQCPCGGGEGAQGGGGSGPAALESALAVMGFAGVSQYEAWLSTAADDEALVSAYVLAALLSGGL